MNPRFTNRRYSNDRRRDACRYSIRLAIAALAAIARLTVIHRAIFAALLARGLISRKCSRANHRRENGKENFGVVFHTHLIFRRSQSCASEKFMSRDDRWSGSGRSLILST